MGGRTVGGGARSRDYQIFCDEKIYFPMARFSGAWKLRYNIDNLFRYAS